MNDSNNLWKQLVSKPRLYIDPSSVDFKEILESVLKKEESKADTKKQYVIEVYNKYCKKLKLKRNDKSIIMFIKDVLCYYDTYAKFVELIDSSDFKFIRKNIAGTHEVNYYYLYDILKLDSMKQFFKDLKDE